jgi:hypothetical protein
MVRASSSDMSKMPISSTWHSQFLFPSALHTLNTSTGVAPCSLSAAYFSLDLLGSFIVWPNAQVNRRRSRRRRAPTLANKMAKPWPVLASALNRQLGQA